MAVHNGSRPDRCTSAARLLAKSFFKLKAPPKDFPKTSLDQLEDVEFHFNLSQKIEDWFSFRVYEPELLNDGQVVWHLRKSPSEKIKKIITIGIYEDHAFLIKDVSKIANVYNCIHCNARFTKSSSFHRHSNTCSKGVTRMHFLNKKVDSLKTTFENAFYPKKSDSNEAIRWLEKESKLRGIHIHHSVCGHGGERIIQNRPVDGYNHETNTVFQYHGCYWHGCRKCFPHYRDEVVDHVQTLEQRYQSTVNFTKKLRDAGYNVVEIWSCEVKRRKMNLFEIKLPKTKQKRYPHFIVFDFEAYGDVNYRKKMTTMLTIENKHVPVSVSIGDSFEREPTHICERDPALLVRKFMAELERRGEKIRLEARREFMPDLNHLTKAQRHNILNWCNQVPVLGFNSGKYDLNLIRKYFAEVLADTEEKVKVAKNGRKIMFMSTSDFKFLDIINYLAPGTSYEKWVKAYGCEKGKSWFPYEWFDSPEKLDFEGLPEYKYWYSKLKGDYLLTKSELRECKKVFEEKGMKTFADWLRYYNNLDVVPGIEAMEKMLDFYEAKGIDILKDAVSIPGVSMLYLLRGAIEKSAELFSPCEEAYYLLNGSLVGGPSLVFSRYHEAGLTGIRSHRVKNPSICKKILCYDANALYLSTMLRDMPCEEGKVVHYNQDIAPLMHKLLKNKKWFGFAEVDIFIPKKLWPKFEEMCPFFQNKEVPFEAVPEHMLEYMKKTNRNRGNGKKLVGSLEAKRILLYAPLLEWYLDHGALIRNVFRTIDYQPRKIFTWFVEEVTEARRSGDVEESKAIFADIFKLLGNSAYGKMIENLEKQKNVIFTKKEKKVFFADLEDLEEIGEAYELESRKLRIEIKRPYQVGVAVYQLAKLRMLEFYYDFIDKFVARKDFELIQMDTDSLYMAISGEKLEDVVKPAMREAFEREKKNWLAWDAWSSRTPGLFKLECEGSRMIALCAKCYFVDGEKGNKFSTKGMSKKQNEISWQRFKKALEGEKDLAKNIGFRMRDGEIVTYEQEKLGLSAYYDKRWVLEDGIHTEPIEFHC